LEEHRVRIAGVRGSSPLISTSFPEGADLEPAMPSSRDETGDRTGAESTLRRPLGMKVVAIKTHRGGILQ
jgi:hypothetical protein